MRLSKRAIAEFFGTFWLVFGGCGPPCWIRHSRSWASAFYNRSGAGLRADRAYDGIRYRSHFGMSFGSRGFSRTSGREAISGVGILALRGGASARRNCRGGHALCNRERQGGLRDFVQLYANVASTAFIAAGIEDIDVDVLVGTIFGSTVAAIPGMHLLASSVLSGSANAFLTLRVGMITKEYCRCTVRVEKMGLRRAATVKAAKLLGSIVRDGTVKLSKATVSASKTKLSQAFERVTGRRGTVETS